MALGARPHRTMDFFPACLRSPGENRVALALGRRALREQLARARETLGRKLTACGGREHGATRLVRVRAVAEAAALGERGDVREGHLDAAAVGEKPELAQAGRVDQHAAAR